MKADNNIPKHVAIIMDGNRRWAKEHKLAVLTGHRTAAEKVIEPLIAQAAKTGVEYLTFWAFSTENWRRDKAEVKGLMDIFRFVLKDKIESFHRQGARLKFLGDLSKFPQDIQRQVAQVVRKTKDNEKITVFFALNYGGRDEILRAIERWHNAYKLRFDRPELTVEGQATSYKLTEEEFSKHLDTNSTADPDLVIRTGGEMRLSGLLPWQTVYSELYFTPVYFPDFSEKEFAKAVAEYQRRQRRYGK